MSAGPSIRFTVLESVTRLSKRYSLASDGKSVIKVSFTQLYEGVYQVAIVPAGDIPAALQTCGKVFDALTYKHAITLGVPRDGSTAGLITTQDKVREGTAPVAAIPRDLEHFGWSERALLFLDGDDDLASRRCDTDYPFGPFRLFAIEVLVRRGAGSGRSPAHHRGWAKGHPASHHTPAP